MEFRQAERGITALYERLSRDDEQEGDSNSIVNQKKMLEEFAARNGFQNVAHYTDDGYSGGSFDRPDWKRIMADIEAGKITTVIAKDMSRIGRNYLEVGYYTEIYFRQKDIHFTAIANGGITASGNKRHVFEAYNCSNYKMRTMKTTAHCFNHHISVKDLRELILYTIREVCTFALADNESFRQKVMEAAALQRTEAVKDRKRKLNRDKRRFAELDVLYKKLYESYATEKIPESKFDELSRDYLAEQDDLKISIAKAENEISEYEQNADNAEQFLSVAQEYTDFSELTTPMINEFIEKIVVHAPDRSNGPRQQQVDIYLKFIGHFIPPEREPTPEELEEMKTKQYWQDRYWKRRDYELARRKNQKAKELEGQAEAEVKRHEERVTAAWEEVRRQAENGELSVLPT